MSKKKVKKESKVPLTIRLKESLVEKLDEAAEVEHRSRTGQVEHVLETYLEKYKNT